jgi:hypothetical protein
MSPSQARAAIVAAREAAAAEAHALRSGLSAQAEADLRAARAEADAVLAAARRSAEAEARAAQLQLEAARSEAETALALARRAAEAEARTAQSQLEAARSEADTALALARRAAEAEVDAARRDAQVRWGCWWAAGGLLVGCWWAAGGLLVGCWWAAGGLRGREPHGPVRSWSAPHRRPWCARRAPRGCCPRVLQAPAAGAWGSRLMLAHAVCVHGARHWVVRRGQGNFLCAATRPCLLRRRCRLFCDRLVSSCPPPLRARLFAGTHTQAHMRCHNAREFTDGPAQTRP